MLCKNKLFLLSVFVLSVGGMPCSMSTNVGEDDNNMTISIDRGGVNRSSRKGTVIRRVNILDFDNDNDNEEIMNQGSNEDSSNIRGYQTVLQPVNKLRSIRFKPQPSQPRQVSQEEQEQKNDPLYPPNPSNTMDNTNNNFFLDQRSPSHNINQAINIVTEYFEEERFVPERILNNEFRFITAVQVFAELYNQAIQGVTSEQNNNNNNNNNNDNDTSDPFNTHEFVVNNNEHSGIKKSVAEEMLSNALMEVKEHFDMVVEKKEENNDQGNDSAIHKVVKILQGSKNEPQISEISSFTSEKSQIGTSGVSKNKQCMFALIAYVEAMQKLTVLDMLFRTLENMQGYNGLTYSHIQNSLNSIKSERIGIIRALGNINNKMDNIGNSNTNTSTDDLPAWKRYQLAGAGVGALCTAVLGAIVVYLFSGNTAKKELNKLENDVYQENLAV